MGRRKRVVASSSLNVSTCIYSKYKIYHKNKHLQKCRCFFYECTWEAQDSDLFDVLEYIAYAKSPVSRAARVETNKDNIFNLLNAAQRDFVDYVLRNYVDVGVDELDIGKLSTVLNAKYGSIHSAQDKLGSAEEIQQVFIEFQQVLYHEAV